MLLILIRILSELLVFLSGPAYIVIFWYSTDLSGSAKILISLICSFAMIFTVYFFVGMAIMVLNLKYLRYHYDSRDIEKILGDYFI